MGEDTSGDGVGVVAEGRASSGRRGGRWSVVVRVVGGSEATIDVSESQGNTTLVGIDDIIEGGLGTARWRGEAGVKWDGSLC